MKLILHIEGMHCIRCAGKVEGALHDLGLNACVAALHYLMKPVSRDKLFAVLDRAAENCRRNARCLNLDLGGRDDSHPAL